MEGTKIGINFYKPAIVSFNCGPAILLHGRLTLTYEVKQLQITTVAFFRRYQLFAIQVLAITALEG